MWARQDLNREALLRKISDRIYFLAEAIEGILNILKHQI